MAYRLVYLRPFYKHFKSFTEIEKKQLNKKLNQLALDPTHPSLRTKRIQGSNKLFESSVNMDIRIIWFFEDSIFIVVTDVGHHDILERL